MFEEYVNWLFLQKDVIVVSFYSAITDLLRLENYTAFSEVGVGFLHL